MEDRTRYLERDGGRIAYDVAGEGPLVVLSPGMADTRATYRFLAPLLARAGYRVATVDLRGHGESSTGWSSHTVADTAADLIAVVAELGGPAVIVGQSFSGGAATIAAANHPEMVRALVEIAPFTRPPTIDAGALVRNARYRRGALLLGWFGLSGSTGAWARYLDLAYPGHKPADWDAWLATLLANLNEPGRVAAAKAMFSAKKTEAAEQLARVRCPVLLVMGGNDSDFVDPEAEAVAIVDLLPEGVGEYTVIPNAGHYPHAEYPQETADAILAFLAEHVRA